MSVVAHQNSTDHKSSGLRGPRWIERVAAGEAAVAIERSISGMSRAVSEDLIRAGEVARSIAEGKVPQRGADRGDIDEVRVRLRAARIRIIAAALFLVEAEQAASGGKRSAA